MTGMATFAALEYPLLRLSHPQVAPKLHGTERDTLGRLLKVSQAGRTGPTPGSARPWSGNLAGPPELPETTGIYLIN